MGRMRFGPWNHVYVGTLGPRRLMRGLISRIAATIAIAAGGLVFIILYLGFLAVHYPWYENLAVVLSTTVLVPVILVAMWALWGLGLSRRYYEGFDKTW